MGSELVGFKARLVEVGWVGTVTPSLPPSASCLCPGGAGIGDLVTMVLTQGRPPGGRA